MEEEVKAGALVRDVGAFARFLETVSFSHAGVLNVSNVVRESLRTTLRPGRGLLVGT
jgi:hypothetical protein